MTWAKVGDRRPDLRLNRWLSLVVVGGGWVWVVPSFYPSEIDATDHQASPARHPPGPEKDRARHGQ